QCFELGLTAQAAGADARSLRKVDNASVADRAEHVLRILALGDGGDFKSRGKFCGQVFKAVNGQVDAVLGEGFFDLLGEHAFGAHLGEREVENLVASGLNDYEFDFVALFSQQCRDVVGLPEGQL